MKKIYKIKIYDEVEYEVEKANNVDDAIDIALSWWDEREPNYKVIVEEEED